MMSDFKVMQENHPEKYNKLVDELKPYLPVLLGKPGYTTAEADKWFAFMSRAQEIGKLALYAINVVLDTIKGWCDEQGKGGRFLKLNFETNPYTQRKEYFAVAFEEVNLVTDWCIRLVGFDTVTYTAVLTDTRMEGRVMYLSLAWCSPFYLCNMLASLRKITPENAVMTLRPEAMLND